MSLFTINKMNLITSWSYILDKNVDCTICRQHLNSDSIYAVEKNKRSTIKTGICGHMFHEECITPWLSTNNKCPICLHKFI
jgi:RING-box protein 1